MYGILVLAIVTVFVAGLMVGRTPEYIAKKIRPTEMKYAALYFLTIPWSPSPQPGCRSAPPSARKRSSTRGRTA